MRFGHGRLCLQAVVASRQTCLEGWVLLLSDSWWSGVRAGLTKERGIHIHCGERRVTIKTHA